MGGSAEDGRLGRTATLMLHLRSRFAGISALWLGAGRAVAWADDEVVVESAPTSAPEALSRADVATALDAGDVLDQLAGVVVRRLGPPGSRTYVSVRGSSFRQVAVHLDGIPLNPDGSAGIDLSGVPVDQVDLRLWRTFAPPAYGAPAMGAVLDAVVVDPPGEGLGCTLHGGDVDVVGCRAQGIGDGGVGPGEQFGVGGHMGNDIRAGFRRIGSQ